LASGLVVSNKQEKLPRLLHEGFDRALGKLFNKFLGLLGSKRQVRIRLELFGCLLSIEDSLVFSLSPQFVDDIKVALR